MKNKKIRNSLIIFVIFLSLGSHTFLNVVSGTTPNVEMENELNELQPKAEVSLPDVKIVEKAVDFIKNMLPLSR